MELPSDTVTADASAPDPVRRTTSWRSLAGDPALRLLVVVELVVALTVAAQLWSMRQQVLEAELRHLSSLAGAMAAQADATLDVAAAALDSTRDELSRGLLVPGRPSADALLHTRAAGLPRFRSLAVADAHGRLVSASRDGGVGRVSLAQREFFAAAREGTPGALHVSLPFVSPADGQPTIAVAVDRRDAAGGFAGVVVLAADPEFLDRDFARLSPSPDTRMAIYRRDLALVADGPGDNSRDWGRDTAAVSLWDDPARERPRAVVSDGGEVRLVVARPLARAPLLLVVSRGQAEALAPWTEQAWLVGGFAASALAVMLTMAVRNAREQARRRDDEAREREERARLEEQLGRTRRMEALGTLAGGVAHDFNNILASVIGYGELARDGASPQSAQARQLDQVLQAGQRGKALVGRILAFSRGAPGARTAFRVQPVVEEVLQLLVTSLPPNVHLVRRLAAPDAVVRADTTAVFEAVMNLCTNGMQAMPAGGALTVALETVEVPAARTLFEGRLAPGRHACLTVADEGTGIPADVLPRLFEPFFTTRGAGGPSGDGHRGTGLGLAVVHGVVVDLGGAIDVHSEVGRGARFVLYFPCIDEAVTEAAPAEAPPLPLGSGEAVLVVDDEAELVALTEEMLAELGYEPYGLTSSAEALRRFEAEPDRFALLLSDEVMPGLSGTALAEAVRRRRPGFPVVLASGWGGPGFEQRAAAAGIAALLAKPLTRAELAHALARALRG